MRKQYKFKQGFENGGNDNTALIIKLSVLTENIKNKDVFRLVLALDKEYQQIVKETSSATERKEFKACHIQLE